MIDLRLLRQFVAVAEELHFHRAAARLHMSQPPLTAAIRRLEDVLGSELIVRGNRTLGLTAAGQTLLVEARATLQQAEQALQRTREAAAGHCGSLRVGYVGSALYGRLPGLIRRFRQQYPQVQLHLHEATSRQQQQWLREQRIDVGVLIPPIPAAELLLHDFDHDRLAIALPRAHALADAAQVRVAMLADEPFVSWPAGEGIGFHAQVLGLCTAAGFTPHVVQETQGMHAVLSLVAVEAGVAIVPASMASFRPEEIVYRELEGDAARFALQFCVRPQQPSPVLGNFLQAATSG
ncbi:MULTISPECIES: LysR family transcriptional regulator [unclassified Stenotrophomonas]|uniref:LysR family transcriptional regulator n=1 Tax=unclassified Stenotrophomonas TaxID=196198 RepID=UPI000D16C65B|nr:MULTISPECIES: LysR family transcriptional regulator [unclassified Stenotrophomonas]PTA73453.1 LysR family transcriptional regulator [Stenotrophomonas sp. Nf1]PTA76316.1 LysR family transcriptional regulator [Stenotrophomonas sp. Nf4]